MHTTLISYIQAHANTILTDQEIAVLQEVFTPRKYLKGQFLLQDGDVCKNYAFLCKGATHKFAVNEKGTENIVALSIENWWVGDRDSYFRETPTIYNIQAYEDCDTLLFSKKDYPRLQKIPAFVEMRLKLDENHAIANERNKLCLIGYSAEKRYENFLQMHPELVKRFPLRIIASYLGITKETLSRIRRQTSI